jgi:hypothetical protein
VNNAVRNVDERPSQISEGSTLHRRCENLETIVPLGPTHSHQSALPWKVMQTGGGGGRDVTLYTRRAQCRPEIKVRINNDQCCTVHDWLIELEASQYSSTESGSTGFKPCVTNGYVNREGKLAGSVSKGGCFIHPASVTLLRTTHG